MRGQLDAMRSNTMPATMNAANEIAVDAFLNHGLRFVEIPQVIRNTTLASHSTGSALQITLDYLFSAFNLTFATGIGLGLALFHQGYPGEGRGLVLFLVGAHLALGRVLVAVEHRLWRSAVGEAGIPALVLGLQFLR